MAKKNTSQKFTKIDQDAIIALRQIVQAHLDSLMKDIGLEVNVGAGTYGGSTGSLKLEFTLPAVGGVPIVFKENCERYGLTLEDFGKQFSYKDGLHRITGLKPGRKYCIQTERLADHKEFWFTNHLIQEALGKNVAKRERMITDLKALAALHPGVPLMKLFYSHNRRAIESDELFGSFEKFVKAAGLEDRLSSESVAVAAGK